MRHIVCQDVNRVRDKRWSENHLQSFTQSPRIVLEVNENGTDRDPHLVGQNTTLSFMLPQTHYALVHKLDTCSNV